MQSKKIDLSTVLGIGIAIFIIVLGIAINGNLFAFLDPPAILIVVFGTFFVSSACFSFKEVIKSHEHIFRMIIWHIEDPKETAKKMIEFASTARTKSPQVLEQTLKEDLLYPFLLKGIMMVVDGTSVNHIEKLLAQEINSTAEEKAKVITILRKSAEVSPAMGLIGTLIGLVGMLGHLSDVSKIGPAMAIALLTTFYGALLAYVVFFPLASKLERNAKEEVLNLRLYLLTVSSIAHKENPRILEATINSLLSPSDHISYFQ